MVESWEDFGNGGWVRDHAYSSHDFGQITSGHNSGWLIVDSDFESGWAPVHELDGSLGLDGGDWGVDVFRDDISSVQHRASHVFTMSGVTFGHHWGWLEGGVGDLGYWQLFVVSFFSGDNWGVWGQHKVDTGVRHQIGLEFSDVHVQGSVESQWGGEGWNHLGDESVQIGVSGSFDVQLSSADVIDGFIVQDNGHISVF